MKKILLLLAVLNIHLLANSQVPNNTTFSLQDVENAITGTQGNLQQCFSDAISSYFDPNYEGSKNSLLNFRNYGNCPTFVSAGSLTHQTSTNSLSVSYPAVTAGDFVFISTGHYSSSTMDISGWTLFKSITYSSYRFSVFYKHFTADDSGGSVSITSSDYVTKFATAYRIKAKSTSSLTHKNSLLAMPTTSYTPSETMTGDACEMALAFAGLFISQGFSITQGTGWTVQQNTWTSGIGAMSLLSYKFTSTLTAPSNTYGFTGQVPFGYISLLIE